MAVDAYTYCQPSDVQPLIGDIVTETTFRGAKRLRLRNGVLSSPEDFPIAHDVAREMIRRFVPPKSTPTAKVILLS